MSKPYDISFLPSIGAFALSLSLMMGCSKSPSPPSTDIRSIHFQLVAEGRSATQSQTATSDIWQKGDRVRIERNDGMVLITSSPYEYKYKKGARDGLQVMNKRQGRMPATPIEETFREVREIKSGKLVGRETVDGVECERYEVARGGQGKSVLWYSVATKFPVKIVDELSGGSTTQIYREVQINLDIPDALFEPPKDVRFDLVDRP